MKIRDKTPSAILNFFFSLHCSNRMSHGLSRSWEEAWEV